MKLFQDTKQDPANQHNFTTSAKEVWQILCELHRLIEEGGLFVTSFSFLANKNNHFRPAQKVEDTGNGWIGP